ncbi:hypothetical protein Btru_030901 [Bulinus truncatus]|nr:hypothetical protein Btru_030901 [Bulinus truncatus]
MLKPGRTPYNQPTLPHLLTEYGFQDTETERITKARQKEKQRRKAVKKHEEESNSFDEYERERSLEKEKEREEHCLQLVRDIYRLRDYYYKEYNTLLAAKVQKQREEIKAKDSIRQKLKEEQEERERLETHKVKKRLKRHTLDQTPPPFYIPKTDLYYIIGLEEKLRRDGKLKTVTDYNKFREEIKNPAVFYNHFKVHKSMDDTNYAGSFNEQQSNYSHGESSDSVYSLEQKMVKLEEKPLGRISESQESMRSNNRTLSQTFSSQSKGKSISSKADDIEKRFPKLEMPKLHCFTMDLSKKLPDPEEIRVDEELKSRELRRKKLARTVTKMYQLAMSNAAVSKRIMDQHNELKMFLEGPNLSDVIADKHWMVAYGMNGAEDEVSRDDENLESLDRTSAFSGSRLQPLPEIKTQDTMALCDIPETQEENNDDLSESLRKNSPTSKGNDKPVFPLTMGEIQTKYPVRESKALSTLWTNYLRAGK